MSNTIKNSLPEKYPAEPKRFIIPEYLLKDLDLKKRILILQKLRLFNQEFIKQNRPLNSRDYLKLLQILGGIKGISYVFFLSLYRYYEMTGRIPCKDSLCKLPSLPALRLALEDKIMQKSCQSIASLPGFMVCNHSLFVNYRNEFHYFAKAGRQEGERILMSFTRKYDREEAWVYVEVEQKNGYKINEITMYHFHPKVESHSPNMKIDPPSLLDIFALWRARGWLSHFGITCPIDAGIVIPDGVYRVKAENITDSILEKYNFICDSYHYAHVNLPGLRFPSIRIPSTVALTAQQFAKAVNKISEQLSFQFYIP